VERINLIKKLQKDKEKNKELPETNKRMSIRQKMLHKSKKGVKRRSHRQANQK